MVQKTLIISKDQTLFDVAIQEYGDTRAVLEIAIANEMSPTEFLVPGQVLILPVITFKKVEIANEFSKKQLKVVTGMVSEFTPPEQKGIGYMIISSTFKVG